ncbi:hypothetical protein EJB05_50119 [Eragrostis curvula]|uniref:Uncharacterized protein n=1 Tax=Eragrostis curvula TaxID=38414 RepID=A0A5J9SZ82_9POAL|nr:hypothetical protein EJB05_50119 [Eragrostis curvula]
MAAARAAVLGHNGSADGGAWSRPRRSHWGSAGGGCGASTSTATGTRLQADGHRYIHRSPDLALVRSPVWCLGLFGAAASPSGRRLPCSYTEDKLYPLYYDIFDLCFAMASSAVLDTDPVASLHSYKDKDL